MRLETIIRRPCSLFVAILLLTSVSAVAGTVTKTFPDLEGQVRLFLDLPLGMTFKEFRVNVPAAWYAVAVPRVELVEDFDGPSNNGWFIYQLAARGIQQPQFYLTFWKNELVFAYFDYKHRFTVGLNDQEHDATVRRIEDLLRRRFGDPERSSTDANGISLSWVQDLVTVRFRASDDGTRPLGDMTLLITHRTKYAAASDWRSNANDAEGTGPGVTVGCSRTDPVSGFVHSIVETIDTRSLSHRAASRHAKKRSESVTLPGFECKAEAASYQAIDILLNMAKVGQRLPYTYLRFTNEDGFLTSRKFQFAGPDTQDAVCEKYRKRLRRSVRKTATYITGTELPYKRY